MADDFLLTPEDVAEIAAILADTKYEKLEVTTLRFRLIVARSGPGWSQDWSWGTSEVAPTGISNQAQAGPIAPQVPASPGDQNGLVPITSAMPGTFYRSPQPGAPPYVNVGDAVEEGTTVGIVETMKLMTPVLARVHGTIMEVLVENGEIIDGDKRLMLVSPDSL